MGVRGPVKHFSFFFIFYFLLFRAAPAPLLIICKCALSGKRTQKVQNYNGRTES